MWNCDEIPLFVLRPVATHSLRHFWSNTANDLSIIWTEDCIEFSCIKKQSSEMERCAKLQSTQWSGFVIEATESEYTKITEWKEIALAKWSSLLDCISNCDAFHYFSALVFLLTIICSIFFVVFCFINGEWSRHGEQQCRRRSLHTFTHKMPTMVCNLKPVHRSLTLAHGFRVMHRASTFIPVH